MHQWGAAVNDWTTQDFLTSSTGQWHTGGIPTSLHPMAGSLSDRSQWVLSPSWRGWEVCPSQRWWLGLSPTAGRTQRGKTTWESCRSWSRSTSLAGVGRWAALEQGVWTAAGCWRRTTCSTLPSRTPSAKTMLQKSCFFTLTMDIVPIVRGGANYSAIAPPGSYIDVNDFSSPRELAEELKRLSNAREEYLNFFRWKAETEVLRRPEDQMGCKLCKALHDKSRPAKSYQDIGAWWNASAFCQ